MMTCCLHMWSYNTATWKYFKTSQNEFKQLHVAFGKWFLLAPKIVPVSDTKYGLLFQSMIGHCIGAAGALEAIATIKAITTGWLHPTINQFVSCLLAWQSLTNNYIDEPCFSFWCANIILINVIAVFTFFFQKYERINSIFMAILLAEYRPWCYNWHGAKYKEATRSACW